jgi:Ca2+:H+ antiporter
MIFRILLVFVPLAVLAQVLQLNPVIVFVLAFIAIIPLASLLGEATEVLAHFAGPKIGGMLNATLGTLTEIIVLFALLRSGQIEVLKASIVGGILMGLLVAIGLALLLGGLKHGVQQFDRVSVGAASATMMLAVVGLMVPTFFDIGTQIEAVLGITRENVIRVTDTLSLLVAVILFVLYLLVVVYQLRTPLEDLPELEPVDEAPKWSLRTAVLLLVGLTIAIAVVGEILSGALEPFGESLGLSPLFMGVALLPVATGGSEILVSARMARRNKVNLGISIPLNGAMQGALFVAPVLVFLSLFGGTPLTLYFGISQIIALSMAVAISAYIAIDGRTSWLEGAQLLALWIILALWFYYIIPLR